MTYLFVFGYLTLCNQEIKWTNYWCVIVSLNFFEIKLINYTTSVVKFLFHLLIIFRINSDLALKMKLEYTTDFFLNLDVMTDNSNDTFITTTLFPIF
jgi:hypothetical protein